MFWISAKESSGFWLGVLNDLKSRGVRHVFIFSVDGLRGLEEAIRASYPDSDIQRCVIHQIRNSLRYVSWREKKELSKDLKEVYGAGTIGESSGAMEGFEGKWGNKYPHIIKSWRENWESLMTYFRYPKFRKVTDGMQKGSSPRITLY
ncbi:MAG: transposase [Thermodesulfobacteriota bacterium]